MAKKLSTEVLNGVCESCPNCSGYCTLKEILLVTQSFDNRVIVQIKCMEIFKYEQSEIDGKDIGWTEAGIRWAELGWAKVFADVYDHDPDIKPRQIYAVIKSRLKSC